MQTQPWTTQTLTNPGTAHVISGTSSNNPSAELWGQNTDHCQIQTASKVIPQETLLQKKINIHDGSKKKTLKFTSMLVGELNRTTNGANKELPRRNIFGKKIFTPQKYKNYTYSTCVTSEQC